MPPHRYTSYIQYYPQDAWSQEEPTCDDSLTNSILIYSTPGSYALLPFNGTFSTFLCAIHGSGTDLILNIGHQLVISGVRGPNGGRLKISMNDIVSIVYLKSEANEPCAVLFNQTFPEGYYLVNMTLLPTTTSFPPLEIRLIDIS